MSIFITIGRRADRRWYCFVGIDLRRVK